MPARYVASLCRQSESIIALTSCLLQISAASHFSNDLGLDSLDTVEVVMAIEEVWLE